MIADTAAVILAGGQGQRLGGKDKGLLKYKYKPLIEYAIEKLACHYKDILISANRHHADYLVYQYPVFSDNYLYKGPLAGIEAAMKQSDKPYLFVYACDIVDIPADLIISLEAYKEDHDVVVAVQKGRPQYLLSIWSKQLLNKIQQAISNDELAVYQFLKQQNVKYHLVKESVWKNINTSKDLS